MSISPSVVADVRLGVNRIKADNEADTFDNYNYDQFGIPKEIQAINAIPSVPPQFAPGAFSESNASCEG